MKFCPKCGAMMLPKKEGNKTVMRCGCGYTDNNVEEFKVKHTVEERQEIKAVEKDIEIRPVDKGAECPKCGHKGALFRTQQTRASDEPETKFYECEKCHHRWRDYS
jgi:DNA-directed RNA polymerase subunit M